MSEIPFSEILKLCRTLNLAPITIDNLLEWNVITEGEVPSVPSTPQQETGATPSSLTQSPSATFIQPSPPTQDKKLILSFEQWNSMIDHPAFYRLNNNSTNKRSGTQNADALRVCINLLSPRGFSQPLIRRCVQAYEIFEEQDGIDLSQPGALINTLHTSRLLIAPSQLNHLINYLPSPMPLSSFLALAGLCTVNPFKGQSKGRYQQSSQVVWDGVIITDEGQAMKVLEKQWQKEKEERGIVDNPEEMKMLRRRWKDPHIPGRAEGNKGIKIKEDENDRKEREERERREEEKKREKEAKTDTPPNLTHAMFSEVPQKTWVGVDPRVVTELDRLKEESEQKGEKRKDGMPPLSLKLTDINKTPLSTSLIHLKSGSASVYSPNALSDSLSYLSSQKRKEEKRARDKERWKAGDERQEVSESSDNQRETTRERTAKSSSPSRKSPSFERPHTIQQDITEADRIKIFREMVWEGEKKTVVVADRSKFDNDTRQLGTMPEWKTIVRQVKKRPKLELMTEKGRRRQEYEMLQKEREEEGRRRRKKNESEMLNTGTLKKKDEKARSESPPLPSHRTYHVFADPNVTYGLERTKAQIVQEQLSCVIPNPQFLRDCYFPLEMPRPPRQFRMEGVVDDPRSNHHSPSPNSDSELDSPNTQTSSQPTDDHVVFPLPASEVPASDMLVTVPTNQLPPLLVTVPSPPPSKRFNQLHWADIGGSKFVSEDEITEIVVDHGDKWKGAPQRKGENRFYTTSQDHLNALSRPFNMHLREKRRADRRNEAEEKRNSKWQGRDINMTEEEIEAIEEKRRMRRKKEREEEDEELEKKYRDENCTFKPQITQSSFFFAAQKRKEKEKEDKRSRIEKMSFFSMSNMSQDFEEGGSLMGQALSHSHTNKEKGGVYRGVNDYTEQSMKSRGMGFIKRNDPARNVSKSESRGRREGRGREEFLARSPENGEKSREELAREVREKHFRENKLQRSIALFESKMKDQQSNFRQKEEHERRRSEEQERTRSMRESQRLALETGQDTSRTELQPHSREMRGGSMTGRSASVGRRASPLPLFAFPRESKVGNKKGKKGEEELSQLTLYQKRLIAGEEYAIGKEVLMERTEEKKEKEEEMMRQVRRTWREKERRRTSEEERRKEKERTLREGTRRMTQTTEARSEVPPQIEEEERSTESPTDFDANQLQNDESAGDDEVQQMLEVNEMSVFRKDEEDDGEEEEGGQVKERGDERKSLSPPALPSATPVTIHRLTTITPMTEDGAHQTDEGNNENEEERVVKRFVHPIRYERIEGRTLEPRQRTWDRPNENQARPHPSRRNGQNVGVERLRLDDDGSDEERAQVGDDEDNIFSSRRRPRPGTDPSRSSYAPQKWRRTDRADDEATDSPQRKRRQEPKPKTLDRDSIVKQVHRLIVENGETGRNVRVEEEDGEGEEERRWKRRLGEDRERGRRRHNPMSQSVRLPPLTLSADPDQTGPLTQRDSSRPQRSRLNPMSASFSSSQSAQPRKSNVSVEFRSTINPSQYEIYRPAKKQHLYFESALTSRREEQDEAEEGEVDSRDGRRRAKFGLSQGRTRDDGIDECVVQMDKAPAVRRVRV
ncbi:hypothetical protein BLNAU_18067 [Blattamonas nauphoetae]|uniref:Uncharacterized protein n=1 Tax=Blattamonas nauphoetae TaxID=2049346 RepID=A0ABQ9X5D2_9EUKA|nr:hypothetical protein BLNAU_18067 [Blattamonas nauphoetae]